MEVDFRHPLSDDDARARLELLGKYLGHRHGISVAWADAARARFSGRYMIVKINGELTLDTGVVRFRGEDPGMLWRKKASQYIQEKLAKYLDPKTPLTELSAGN